jgi:hypothetical protein
MSSTTKENFVSPLALAFLLATGIMALYFYRPWGLFFLNDDFIHIPLSAQKIFGQHNSIRNGNDISLFLDSLLFGKNPVGYHVTNLILHILSSFAVFYYVRQLVSVIQGFNVKYLPLLSAYLFFIYPFHSESIYWIIGRTGSLSALLFLLSLIFFHQAHKGILFQLMSGLLFACSLSVYESVWIFPLPLLWSVWLFTKYGKNSMKPFLVTTALFISVFGAFLFLRFKVQHEFLGAYELESVSGQSPYWPMALNYFRLFVRSFTMPQVNTVVFVSLGMLIFFLLAGWVMWSLKKRRNSIWLIFTISCFLFALTPYVTLGIDTHGTESERYLYLPSVFFCILVGTLICNISSILYRSSVCMFVAGYFIVALGFSSKNYRLASDIVKNTFEVLNQVPQGDTVIFRNLPRDHRGAIMLGLGLSEGYEWLIGSNQNVSLLIENITLEDNFFKDASISFEKNIFPKDLAGIYRDAITGQMQAVEINPQKTWVIAYGASGILVFKSF